jgi:hypothetical protein
MQEMLEFLQKNAAPTVARHLQPPGPVFRPEKLLRSFAREPQEDPEAFIQDNETYFDKVGANHSTSRHHILVAYRQLRGDVNKRHRYILQEPRPKCRRALEPPSAGTTG